MSRSLEGSSEVPGDCRKHRVLVAIPFGICRLPGGIAARTLYLSRSLEGCLEVPGQPGGLSFAGLTAVLRELLRSPRAAGLHIGIYDPDLDPTGEHGRALTDALVAAPIEE